VCDGVICCTLYRLECSFCHEADQALYDAV
jgi:hypothetical protein